VTNTDPIYVGTTRDIWLRNLHLNKVPYTELQPGDSIECVLISNIDNSVISGPVTASYDSATESDWRASMIMPAIPQHVHIHWNLSISGKPFKFYDYIYVEKRPGE
jgi:hypothetical protein